MHLNYTLDNDKEVVVFVWGDVLSGNTTLQRQHLSYYDREFRSSEKEKFATIINKPEGGVFLKFTGVKAPKHIEDFKYLSIEEFKARIESGKTLFPEDLFALLYKEAGKISFINEEGKILVPIEDDWHNKASWSHKVPIRVENKPTQGDGDSFWSRNFDTSSLLIHRIAGTLKITHRTS